MWTRCPRQDLHSTQVTQGIFFRHGFFRHGNREHFPITYRTRLTGTPRRPTKIETEGQGTPRNPKWLVN